MLATVLGIGLTSCEKEENLIDTRNNITFVDAKNAQGENIYNTQSENQRVFGKALLEAMKNSPALRKFIRTEALKKFNHDYDVLFATVKNEIVEDNKTFRDIILENVESEEILKQIEFTNPLLTIFVPSLPENSFSAQTWDTENQIPDVALRLFTTNDVPCFSLDKGEYVIEAKYIPSYPIIVVKQNERVTSSLTKGYELSHVKQPFNVVNGVEYKFADNAFDNRKFLTRRAFISSRIGGYRDIDQKVVDAYNIYKNNNGWQRDYIYYDITPSSPNGEPLVDFQEQITYFKLNEIAGSGINLYNHISDQTDNSSFSDAKMSASTSSVQSSFWTDGDFEFYLSILINSKNGLGSELPKGFIANPEQLFHIEYRYLPPFYVPVEIKTKSFNPNLEIIDWDIEKYATTIRINVEERDRTEAISITTSKSSDFATNFGLDSDSIFKKLGLKFGVEAKTSRTDNMSINYVQGNDDLLNVTVNFADAIITNDYSSRGGLLFLERGTAYEVRKYSSSYFTISLEPVRVQP